MQGKGRLFLVAASLFLFGCEKEGERTKINVILEDSPYLECASPILSIKPGEDASFSFRVKNNGKIASVSYGDHSLHYEDDGSYRLDLHNVLYPEKVSLEVVAEGVSYFPSGGKALPGAVTTFGIPSAHLRMNVADGEKLFAREGYAFLGWGDSPESSSFVPSGSRVGKNTTSLYAIWEKETPLSDFRFLLGEGYAILSEYLGDEERVILPKTVEGKPLIAIESGAFNNKSLSSIFLPSSLRTIQSGAFSHCPNLSSIQLHDGTLREFADESFLDCPKIKTLLISANEAPCFSGTYFDAFQDKLDYLRSIKEEKKIVLFSGSSTRYGFQSPLFEEAFDCKVSNMGVFAYLSAEVQLEAIRPFLKEGDIFIDAPELERSDYQFFANDEIEAKTFAMFESDFASFGSVDLTHFTNEWDALSSFFALRDSMGKRSYSVEAKWFDDDENRYDYPTYNIQGDMTIVRPNHPKDEWISQPLVLYDTSTVSDEEIECFNRVYESLKADGIDFFFDYAPKNRNCLTPESTPEKVRALGEKLNSKIKAPILSSLDEALKSGVYFWKIDNHLSDEGAKLRSEETIRDLKSYYGD